MKGHGIYYDGLRPISRKINLEIDGSYLLLIDVESGETISQWLLAEVSRDQDHNTAFYLKHNQGLERVEVIQFPQGLERYTRNFSATSNKSILFTLGIIAIVLLLGIGTWFLAAPISQFIATKVPYDQEVKLSRKIDIINESKWKVCKGSNESNLALSKILASLEIPQDLDFKIETVDLNIANAIAYPGGQIVIFDGLLKKVTSGDEIAGVIAHEIGHIVKRHSMAVIVRTSIFAMMLSFISGDFSSAFALDPSTVMSMATLSFSREMEHEADLYALEILKKSKISSSGMKDFFSRQELKSDTQDKWMSFLSTHPEYENRIETFNVAYAHRDEPVLTPHELDALKRHCIE